MSTVGLALSRRDVLAILVTGLLLLLLVLSGVAPGELGVARPTDVVGSAAVPAGRCDLGTPCATEIAAAAHAPCAASTPCAPDTVTAPATADELLGVDALIANVLCDLNSPCVPDVTAAWNRLCDLNTPCLPGGPAPAPRR